MMRRALLVLSVLISTRALAHPAEVRTSLGWVRGVEETGVTVFRGIPYAQPPYGELRWQPPLSPEPWDGVRDTSTYGHRCPQRSMFGKPEEARPSFDDGAEDCLNLNIWVPQHAGTSSLPVMVYLHGGGFDSGSGVGVTKSDHLYSAEKLAVRGEVIVVSLNYRLGALGFLAEPALSATSRSGTSGNFGLMDQIAALQWVQREIAAFGGDPGNVTLFGESSGAMSICSLVAQTKYRGLFQRAIMQSGACQAKSRAAQEKKGEELAARYGCAQADLAERAACLRKLPVARLVAEQPMFTIWPYARNPGRALFFGPVVDGDLLTDRPLSLIERGAHQDVPMIIGSNEEELPSIIFSPVLTKNQYLKMLMRIGYTEAERERVLAVYSRERFGSYAAASAALGTDLQFNCPSRAIMRALDKHRPGRAYSYNFAVPLIGLSKKFIGTFHGIDVLFVLQKLRLGDVMGAAETARQRIAAIMGDYWTTFAKTSVPSSARGPTWESFRHHDAKQMRLEEEMRMIAAQRDAECATTNSLSVSVDR